MKRVTSIITILFVVTVSFSQSLDAYERHINSSNGRIAAGFTFLTYSIASVPLSIAAGKNGNMGGTIALGLTGGVSEIIGPILISGGGSEAERALRASNSSLYKPNKSWNLYKAGLVFSIASRIFNLIPAGKVELHHSVEQKGYTTVEKSISFSPISVSLSSIAQIIHLSNGIYTAGYNSEVKSSASKKKVAFDIVPNISKEKYSLALKCNF